MDETLLYTSMEIRKFEVITSLHYYVTGKGVVTGNMSRHCKI